MAVGAGHDTELDGEAKRGRRDGGRGRGRGRAVRCGFGPFRLYFGDLVGQAGTSSEQVV